MRSYYFSRTSITLQVIFPFNARFLYLLFWMSFQLEAQTVENKTIDTATPSNRIRAGYFENPPVVHTSKFFHLKNGSGHEITEKNKYMADSATDDTPLDVKDNDHEKLELVRKIRSESFDNPVTGINGKYFPNVRELPRRSRREAEAGDQPKRRKKKFRPSPLLCGK